MSSPSNQKKFDPWRVASVIGWTLLALGICAASGWVIVRSVVEFYLSRGEI